VELNEYSSNFWSRVLASTRGRSNKVPFTFDRLGRCFRFVSIYACVAVFFLCCYRFSANKDLYIWINIRTARKETALNEADGRV